MSLTVSRLIVTSSISRLPCLHSTSFAFNPTSDHASFLKSKNLIASYNIVHGFGERILRYDPMLGILRRRSFVVNSNTTPPPDVPLPSGSPSGSIRNWVLGIVLAFVIPFCTHKWGPLLLLKNQVDTVVNTAEHLAETIEAVAEKVDHVIDSITDDLPENSKLRKNLESVDELVERVAKSAQIANNIIDKVEEVEDRLESILNEVKVEAVSKEVVVKKQIPTQEPKVE